MTSREETRRILRERARELAREPVRPTREPMTDVVEFRLAGERYAIETAHLREVQPLRDLTPVPCTPPFVSGIVSVRGRILTVIDLKTFFDLPASGLHDLHQVLIAQAADMELGILVDSVTGHLSVPASALHSPPPTLTGIRAEFLKGVTGDRLAVLDAGRILGDPRILVNEVPETMSRTVRPAAAGEDKG